MNKSKYLFIFFKSYKNIHKVLIKPIGLVAEMKNLYKNIKLLETVIKMIDDTRLQTDIFRANILAHLKTDNVLVDIIIGTFVMTFINRFVTWISKLNVFYNISKLFRFRLSKKNEIILTRKEYISTNVWDTKISYPKCILAIYNYINKNNLFNTGSMRFMEYKSKQPNEVSYIIDSKIPIPLKNDIYFEMICSEDGRTVAENNKGEKTLEHRYSVYSYKKSLKELSSFMTELIRDLEKDVIEEMNKKPFYFIFDKKEEGTLYFDEYNLENDRNFDNIFFDEKIALKNRLDFFIKNREWYSKKGIPYTLGLMFSGKPGCGKTSTIKAIAKYTNRHIIDIPLNKIDSCRDLMNIFYGEEINGKKIPMNKRIYLFEDIDTIIDVLKEREKEQDKPKDITESVLKQNANSMEKIAESITKNSEMVSSMIQSQNSSNKQNMVVNPFGIKQNDKLNLGFFLNLIDGVLETPGRILIISTNFPDKLDKALVRPGRIDMKIHLEKCSKQMIMDILQHYYELDFNNVKMNDEIIHCLYSKQITPAELYQFCFKFKSYDFMVLQIQNQGIDIVFNQIIDREQEAKLEKEKELILTQKDKSKRRRNSYRRESSDEDYGGNRTDEESEDDENE